MSANANTASTADATGAVTDVPPATPALARLYRCYACHDTQGVPGRDFSAPSTAVPVCPKCGTSKADPRIGGLIETLATIHFEPPHPHPELGKIMGIGHLACEPKRVTGDGGSRYTGERSVVNCPACKLTPAYLSAVGAQFDPQFDYAIEAVNSNNSKGGA